ncbi:MAG: hypothetical protein WCO56_17415 [Verrucomicrobiota bacterium]
MKLVKLLTVAAVAAAILVGTTLTAEEGCCPSKKGQAEKACCVEAKKDGKVCEKCAKAKEEAAKKEEKK